MIRAFQNKDLRAVMQIWLQTNIHTHSFIPKEYWRGKYSMVEEMLPQAELYVCEDDSTNQIEGFVGLMNNEIAGIFVRETAQSKGIGKHLLNYVKAARPILYLYVYRKNTRAIRFYERENFEIRSESIDGDTNEQELIMVWKKNACG